MLTLVKMFLKKLKMNKIKMSDIFTYDDIINDGFTIFKALKETLLNPFPLTQDFINSNNYQTLNYDYFVGYSADKFLSPLARRILIKDNEFSIRVTRMATIIYNRFATKWKKIYDALMTSYNPLENYSMEEVRTPNLTTKETTNENTDINVNRETTASNSYKGFNSDNPVLVNKTDGNEDVTTTGAEEVNEIVKESEHKGTETLTRSGNIGVTTSQQMLESEFKVRQYDFYKMIYNDIDSVLCLSIY